MATQEERLQKIFAQMTEAISGINTLKQQLADLKASNPDIEDEIAALEGTATQIMDALPKVEPAPEPTPTEPPAEPTV